METKFTPGPWTANRYVGERDNWFVRGPNDERVCGSGSGPVVEANARLIAAAPDLYEALTEMMASFDDRQINPNFKPQPAVAKAEAALAKARGES